MLGSHLPEVEFCPRARSAPSLGVDQDDENLSFFTKRITRGSRKKHWPYESSCEKTTVSLTFCLVSYTYMSEPQQAAPPYFRASSDLEATSRSSAKTERDFGESESRQPSTTMMPNRPCGGYVIE